MDSKVSPLAMLAKTCSQIGADPIPVKKQDKSPNKTPKARSRSSSTEILVTDASSTTASKPKKTLTPVSTSPASISLPASTYPSPAASTNSNPFLASFASSLSSESVCRDPLCRDPLCPTALRNQQHLSYYYKEAMMAFTLAQQRMAAAQAALASSPASGSSTLGHVCNWVSGKDSNLKPK